MQISVWYIVVAALLFFVFGAGIAVAIDAHLIAHWRRSAKTYEAMLAMFLGACRAVLSDAFYKRFCGTSARPSSEG